MVSGAKPQEFCILWSLERPRQLKTDRITGRKRKYCKDFFEQNRLSFTFIKKKKNRLTWLKVIRESYAPLPPTSPLPTKHSSDDPDAYLNLHLRDTLVFFEYFFKFQEILSNPSQFKKLHLFFLIFLLFYLQVARIKTQRSKCVDFTRFSGLKVTHISCL